MEGKASHRYGRGKFEAHPNYLEYMRMIVDHPNYAGMPAATSEDGRINWQVSSGRTTSFYKYYVARRDWWVSKADELALPGSGKERDRFSIAARLIHPTGYRACRLCGEDKNVGYFFLNATLASRLNKAALDPVFERGQSISEVLEEVDALGGPGESLVRELLRAFPERAAAIKQHGLSTVAFEETNEIRSRLLSPGFMANPPDRLDGFHDYCLHCRQANDPGRAPKNMRSYQHDRRAFEWWAEGDWALADALYNAAGPGVCVDCGEAVAKVSPDHVGPLACGFKQLPLFVPTCQPCNSSKNRRMRLSDVHRLLAYEAETDSSAASWQVRGLWDAHKDQITTDAEAVALSSEMRALQDVFLRVLHELLQAGEARFLSTLLSPDYALYKHEFHDLDPGALTFTGVETTQLDTRARQSLACRSVRIGFEELRAYAEKEAGARKLRKTFATDADRIAREAVALARERPSSPMDATWRDLMLRGAEPEAVEAELLDLVWSYRTFEEKDQAMRALLAREFYRVGAEARVSLD